MNQNQMPIRQWFKSRRSGPNCDNCVEIQFLGPGKGVELRDSKDPDGPTRAFTPGEWDAFLGGVRDGEFDIPAHAR